MSVFWERFRRTLNEKSRERIRETALQAYLDRMTKPLLEKGLRESKPDSEVRSIARLRTLTILRGIDSNRKGRILQFLHESALITRGKVIIHLKDADLSRAYLWGTDLHGVYLRKTNLREADLRKATLRGIKLNGADLRKAKI